MSTTQSFAAKIDTDHTIQNVNDHFFLNSFRLTSSDLIGQKTQDLPKSAFTAMLHNLATLTIEQGEPIHITNQIDQNHAIKVITGHCIPSPMNDGSVWLVMIDSTQEYKQNEESLRQEKLNSLCTFSRGVAHSMNNALVGIIGHASLAEQSLPPYHAARFNIDQLLKAADHTAELAAQLMTYAGHHETTPRPTVLSSFLKDNLPMLKAGMPESAEIQIEELADDTPTVLADTKLLQNGLISTTSALAASAQSSSQVLINISITRHLITPDSDELHTLSGKIEPGEYACIHLKMPGGNIKPSEMRQWFDPFHHTRYSGSPIGAASLLAAARLHSGGLDAFIDSQKTLHLRLLLPAAKKDIGSDTTEHSQKTEFKAEGIALVIDDEPAVRDVSKEILTQLGFEVLTADTGESGLDAATKNIEKLTLVLLDLHMPSLGGAETFRGLRLIQPRLRILISSGYSQTDAMKHFPSSSGTAFLQKPYRVDDLNQAVRELFTRPI